MARLCRKCQITALEEKDRELSIGNFYDVRVTDAMDFDLYGVVENN